MARKSKRRKTNKAEKDGCLECGQVSDDGDDDEDEQWIQREPCLGWVHQSCGGPPWFDLWSTSRTCFSLQNM